MPEGLRDQLLMTISKTFHCTAERAEQIFVELMLCVRKKHLVSPHRLTCLLVSRRIALILNINFLLLTCYVSNAAKRSVVTVTNIYIEDWPTDQRPMTDLSFGKFQMAISPQRIIRSTPCLVLAWGFWGWRIEWHYFRFAQIQDAVRRPSWKIQIFKWWFLCNGSSDSLHVWF